MKLNQATDYAFRMILHMAMLPSGQKVTGGVLAEQEMIPERFLLKIMRSLIAAGIMKSFRGVDGGFALNREPKDISMLDVIRAVEGDTYYSVVCMMSGRAQKHVWANVQLMKLWLLYRLSL